MTKKPLYKIGMVFGVFDGLHKGHEYFLTMAARRCEKLIVVVTLPKVAKVIKQHAPRFGYRERVASIRVFNPHLKIVPCDKALGEWAVLKKYSPEIILLGHDQLALASALKKIQMPHIILGAHYPKKYKSSIIHRHAAK